MPIESARPGPEVVLHIGTMKSGTSYLQAVLRRNKRVLNRHGIVVPRNLVPAVSDVMGRQGITKERPIEGAWQRFLDVVESWDGHQVVASQEFLAGATPEEAKTVVARLPRPDRVRVVITNRDLSRVVPSHWQTVVKNGATWPFPDYVRLVLEAPGFEGAQHRYSRGFWRHHDIARIVANWADVVGLENVTLVTVPPSGSSLDQLWRRFAQALDLDPDAYDSTATAKSNVSLSFAETEMLRQVNLQVRKRLAPLEYRLIVNKYLANRLLRRPPEPDVEPDRPQLGEASYEEVRRRADAMLDALAASGVRVIGDLEDLRVAPYRGEPDAPDTARPRDPIPESVPQAIGRLVLRISRIERKRHRAQQAKQNATVASGSSGTERVVDVGAAAGAAGSSTGGRGRNKKRKRAKKEAAPETSSGYEEFDDFDTTAYAHADADEA